MSRLGEQGKGTQAEAILTNDTQQCRNWWILNGDIVSVEQVSKSQRVHFFCYVFFKSAKQRNQKPPSEWAWLTDPHRKWLILGLSSPSPLSLLSSPLHLLSKRCQIQSWVVFLWLIHLPQCSHGYSEVPRWKNLHSSLQTCSPTCSRSEVLATRAWQTWTITS